MNALYNQEVKDKFLLFVDNQETALAYSRIFKRSASLEKEYGKDLYDFSFNELKIFFEELKPKTKTASRTSGRITTKYINWAIENNLTISKIHPLENESTSFFEQFVPNQEEQYLTHDEIHYIIDELTNDNDAVIVALLFEGIQGKEASEIRNLKITDIHKDEKGSYVKVYDDKDGIERSVYVSKNTLKLIKRSHSEPEYYKRNNETNYENPRANGTVELPTSGETPYVVKTGKTQGIHYGERASKFTIYNRIEMIRSLSLIEDAGMNPEVINTKNIVRSGMIYEAVQLLKNEGGELDKNKIKKVCEKFNVKSHWAVKDFINMEVIESLYGSLDAVKN